MKSSLLLFIAVLIGCGIFVRNLIQDKGKSDAANAELKVLGRALHEYEKTCLRIPTSEEGLMALFVPPKDCLHWKQPAELTSFPKDPWGNSYVYKSDGKKFRLYSLGKDGIEGGTGIKEDIVYREILTF